MEHRRRRSLAFARNDRKGSAEQAGFLLAKKP